MFQALALVLPIVASAIGAMIVLYIRNVDKKMDAAAEELKAVNARLGTLDHFIRSELRLMDVRVARIEAHLWPESIRRSL